MNDTTYLDRRGEIEHYFDRTAVDAWARLTSSAPVSGIRATVRAGRDKMRETLLNWLPDDLSGKRVLDAGWGTGALAFECARMGAKVVAIDLSPTLVNLARDRLPADINPSSIEFCAGDMLDPALGEFDHVVGMDSLIHYEPDDVLRALAALAPRTRDSVLFTFAPRTPLLATMRVVGRAFPRANRAPWIVPVAAEKLKKKLYALPQMQGWESGRTFRVSTGFYTSQAIEWRRK
jgi:magnesium-protoporphyrin O-methyltransferase